MKRGITVEFDMHEECYHIQKQKGTLTLEEIQQALNEYHGEDQFFIFMDTNNSYYDEQGSWVDVAPKGDYVKAYLYSTIQRMFEGGEEVKALLINDRSVEEIEIENKLEALQKEVGGYIETVTLVRGYAVMIVNEEGLLLGTPSNLTASAVAARKIVGPALVVGVDGEEFTDIPKDVERRIMTRWA